MDSGSGSVKWRTDLAPMLRDKREIFGSRFLPYGILLTTPTP